MAGPTSEFPYGRHERRRVSPDSENIEFTKITDFKNETIRAWRKFKTGENVVRAEECTY